MKNLLFPASAALLALVASCSGGQSGDGEVKTMRVAEFIGVDSIDNLSEHIRIVNVCQPEFTDSSMLNLFIVGEIADGKIRIKSLGHDRESSWLCTFSYPEGKLLSAFNPFGGGPEEIARGYYASYSPADGGKWSIYNAMFDFCETVHYTSDGKYLGRDTVRGVQGSMIYHGEKEAIGVNTMMNFDNGPATNRDRMLMVINSKQEIIDTIPLQRRRWAPYHSQLMDPICSYGGEAYINDRDTIFRVDIANRRLVPHIATLLGDYGYDWGSIETDDALREVKSDHITPLNPVFNSRYAFVSFALGRYNNDGNLYLDVYDLNDGSLVFRRKQPLDNDADWGAGVPLTIDGLTYRAWPLERSAASEHMIMVVPADEVANVQGTDEANPIIVEVDFK